MLCFRSHRFLPISIWVACPPAVLFEVVHHERYEDFCPDGEAAECVLPIAFLPSLLQMFGRTLAWYRAQCAWNMSIWSRVKLSHASSPDSHEGISRNVQGCQSTNSFSSILSPFSMSPSTWGMRASRYMRGFRQKGRWNSGRLFGSVGSGMARLIQHAPSTYLSQCFSHDLHISDGTLYVYAKALSSAPCTIG